MKNNFSSSYNTLLNGVLNAAFLHPENYALVVAQTAIKYVHLISTAEQWATALLNQAKQPRLKRIVIFSSRSVTGYIAVIAALMTGATFIPLNPRLPTARNISILKQCEPDAIIVDKDSIAELCKIAQQLNLPKLILAPTANNPENLATEIAFLNLDNVSPSAFMATPVSIETRNLYPIVNSTISEEDDAYILFTSGSSGQPKGVAIKHKNICSFLTYNQKRYQITPEDKFSQTFELTFDLAIFDLFMAWCHGACVYGMRTIDLIAPAKYINDNKITIWFSVPAIIALVQNQGFLTKNCFPSLRLSLFCGEALLESQMRAWAAAAPNSLCENLYGPTELTLACSVYQWQRNKKNISHNQILSIGKVYPHLDFILVDDNHLPVSGNEGELCVAGNQQFSGYLNPLAVSPFLHLKNKAGNVTTYYRTGDRVKLDPSGNLLYLGRNDQQIKLNGYRIEMGEIEAALNQIEGVTQAVVFCLNDKENKKLAACLAGKTDPAKVLNHLNNILPTYMLPAYIKVIPEFPLNTNGKIDRKAIQEKIIREMQHVATSRDSSLNYSDDN